MSLRFDRSRKSRKDVYLEQYESGKVGGHPFFPDTLAHDAVVAFLVVAVVFILAIVLPARTEAPADPTSTTYNPRPEWYFLFYFEFLKLFPGFLEPVAAVIIPLAVVVVLVLVPFLSRGLDRRWGVRRRSIGIGALFLAVVLGLEVTGIVSAPLRPAVTEDPSVSVGLQVYRDINCSYCHSINGVGGSVGPDLSGVGAGRDEPTLTAYLQDPSAMIPGTLHPKLQFTSDELHSLVAYLLTLGAPISYSPEAPKLFEQYCSACHAISGKGGTVGPDLSGIGNRRALAFLESFIIEPRSVSPVATMPAFRDVLSPEQTADIAAYLYSLRGPAP